MKRTVVVAGVSLTLLLVSTAVSGAASKIANKRSNAQATDQVCANLIQSRNAHSYPPDRQWVWAIPNGCVFTRDLPRPAGCTADRDLGCAAPPNLHVRFQRKDYVFRLTMNGSPAKALGISSSGAARRLLVAHDGRGAKARQTLIIDFTGVEFDGIIRAGQGHGLIPDLGPLLHWRIAYTIDKKKGLCCPRVDPGSPNTSPFDVAPERLRAATG